MHPSIHPYIHPSVIHPSTKTALWWTNNFQPNFLTSVGPGDDFIKQYTPYAWNLSSASILFTLIWHHAVGPCAQLMAYYSKIWLALRHAPYFYEFHPSSKNIFI
jgi:hypothetical protein